MFKWFKRKEKAMNSNSIRVIHPYRILSGWAFDDPSVGLVREPFVSGADTMIDSIVQSRGLGDNITLFFSESPFPDHELKLVWDRSELGGNWYQLIGTEIKGWLCPALYKYFVTAPETIYLKIG